MTERPDFQPVEIDEVDRKLIDTADRKRIPSITVPGIQSRAAAPRDTPVPKEPSEKTSAGPRAAPRKPLSLEVPDYLATRLKVDAAQQSVTVRHLVLSALADAGYEIHAVDMDEDGRRLR